MRIATSYIFKQIAVGFMILTFSLLGIVWLTQSLRFINMTIGKGLPFALFIKITVLLIPKFLLVLSPISLFAVTLFVYNRMNSDRELIVLKSSSFSNLELSKAPFMMSIIMYVVCLVFSLKIIPNTHMAFRDLQWQIRNDISHLIIQEGSFNSISDTITVYVQEIDKDNHLKNIIINMDDLKKRSITLAEKGALVYRNGVPRIIMNNGSRQEIDAKTGIFSILNFDTYTIDFDNLLSSEKKRDLKYEELSVSELREILKNPEITRRERLEINVEIHDRFVKPLYNIAFGMLACIGILLGYFNRNGNFLKTFMIVGVMVIFQSLSLSAENLANRNNEFILYMYFLPLSLISVCAYLTLHDDPERPFIKMSGKLKQLFSKIRSS